MNGSESNLEQRVNESELTYKAALAVLIWELEHPGEINPRWLAMDSMYQRIMLEAANAYFLKWTESELAAKAGREVISLHSRGKHE